MGRKYTASGIVCVPTARVVSSAGNNAASAVLWLCALAALALLISGRLRHVVGQDRAPVSNAAEQTVDYSVWLREDISPPRLLVSIRVPVEKAQREVAIQMPVWSPGDYHIQNHGRFVQDVRATAMSGSEQTTALPVSHPEPSGWRVETRGAPAVQFTYSLPNTPPGIFSDNLTMAAHYAFINGPAALAYVVDHKNWKTRLFVYTLPTWTVETALPALDTGKAPGSAAFSAPDYDTLADSPVVAGDGQGMVVRQFEVDKVQHRVVFFHNPPTVQDTEPFVPMLRKVVKAENDIMGGPPYDRYDFLLDVGGGGGGLEHLNSSRLLLWPGDTPRDFEYFVAHEFFHLWNVKRIRPAVLGPFDYIHPPKTHNLWFAEGVTEYYAHVAVRRAGLDTRSDFFRHWRRAIARLASNPARKRVTAEEASFRVWESGNSQGFGGLSYYDKGELIGLCLDLKIRHVTNGEKSLDNVMRLLMQRHNPPKPGYGEDEIRATISEVAGQDLSAFYDTLVRSTAEMPFAECLAYAGLDAELNPLPNANAGQTALRESWSSATSSAAGPNAR